MQYLKYLVYYLPIIIILLAFTAARFRKASKRHIEKRIGYANGLVFLTWLIAGFLYLVIPKDRPQANTGPYQMMYEVFKGSASESEIQTLVQGIMMMYHMPDDNDAAAEHIGDVAISLSKKSAVGVTEMQILRDVYQNGSASRSFDDQAVLSAAKLERISNR